MSRLAPQRWGVWGHGRAVRVPPAAPDRPAGSPASHRAVPRRLAGTLLDCRIGNMALTDW